MMNTKVKGFKWNLIFFTKKLHIDFSFSVNHVVHKHFTIQIVTVLLLGKKLGSEYRHSHCTAAGPLELLNI